MTAEVGGEVGSQAVGFSAHEGRRQGQATDLGVGGREPDTELRVRGQGAGNLDILRMTTQRYGRMDDRRVGFL